MFMIYGVSDCPYCLKAQAECMSEREDYAWVMMDWSSNYRDYIKEKFGWTTYPIITKLDYETGEEELIGGHFELCALLSNIEQHNYYVQELHPGDLVKWIIDYRVFEADEEGGIYPVEAVWAKGIIIEVSGLDPLNVVVLRIDNSLHQMLHMIHDGFVVISKANGG